MLESFHVKLDVPEERLETAVSHFERALALEPDFAPAVAGLSMVEGYYVIHGVDRSEERRARSLELARRALEMEPLLPEAHLALGDAFQLQSVYDQAIESLRGAVRLDQENAVAWCHLAYAGNGAADYETAEEAARNAVRLYPDYYWSHVQLGRALLAQGRGDDVGRSVAWSASYYSVLPKTSEPPLSTTLGSPRGRTGAPRSWRCCRELMQKSTRG